VAFGISVPDGEDIVQETFLALFHHVKRGRSCENLNGWLFRVAHNLALKCRARTISESVRLGKEGLEIFEPGPNPEECILFDEKHARLQSIVQALPIGDQLCLRLRAEGLPYREIAEIVGISLGSVSASLSRSFARLERGDRG
jgi:RNA polymerase sigma-70 factor (ECF subfamily)